MTGLFRPPCQFLFVCIIQDLRSCMKLLLKLTFVSKQDHITQWLSHFTPNPPFLVYHTTISSPPPRIYNLTYTSFFPQKPISISTLLDDTSQRRDVLGMIPLLCGLDGSGILAKRAKTSMRVRVDRGWWMDVDWRAQYGARIETMETRGNFYATAVSWVMLEQSFIFESIAPSRYAMFSAHFR